MPARPNDTQKLLEHWRESVPNDRLAHLIRDVARAQMKALQSRLAVHGVSFGHWTFLRILWIKDGLTQKELSDLAGVMEPTTFSAVKAMESMGLIERRHLSGNRKNMHVFLTAAGRGLEKKLVPLAEEVNQISVEGIHGKSIAALRVTLLAMIENLAKAEDLPDSAQADGHASDAV
jgi:DNA-binding MarR family transcriptional regulator